MNYHPTQGGVQTHVVVSCYRNRVVWATGVTHRVYLFTFMTMCIACCFFSDHEIHGRLTDVQAPKRDRDCIQLVEGGFKR